MNKPSRHFLALAMLALPAALPAQVMPEPKPAVACGPQARQVWNQWIDWFTRDQQDRVRLSILERLQRGSPAEMAQANADIMATAARQEKLLAESAGKPIPMLHPVDDYVGAWYFAADKLTSPAKQALRRIFEIQLDHCDWWRVNALAHPTGNFGWYADYFLALGGQALGRADLVERARTGLSYSLDYIPASGAAVYEYNCTEGHWAISPGYLGALAEVAADRNLGRMARILTERIWIEYLLNWHAPTARQTGASSRNNLPEMLGTFCSRLMWATYSREPIYLGITDFLRPDGRQGSARQALMLMAARSPFPAYFNDLAWEKSYPHELRARSLSATGDYRTPQFPPGVDPLRHKDLLNYQTERWVLGSVSEPYFSSTSNQMLIAFWKRPGSDARVGHDEARVGHDDARVEHDDARVTQSVPPGSPRAFRCLYAHYVTNGARPFEVRQAWDGDKPLSFHPYWGTYEYTNRGYFATLQEQGTGLIAMRPWPCFPDETRHLTGLSAVMCLYDWEPTTDGMYVNEQPLGTLPAPLRPGDWWFIADGDVYAGVRPLECSNVGGGGLHLDKALHHIILWADNYRSPTQRSFTESELAALRSGFVVEMGDRGRDGSFEQFRRRCLTAKVAESDDHGVREAAYQRAGRALKMRVDAARCILLDRQVEGRPYRWLAMSTPEFVQDDSGTLRALDATAQSRPGTSLWLLTCRKSQAYVLYQPNYGRLLPVQLHTPLGEVQAEHFPFGKIVLRRDGEEVRVELDAQLPPFGALPTGVSKGVPIYEQRIGTIASLLELEGMPRRPKVTLNGESWPVEEVAGQAGRWRVQPYAKLQ